MTHARDNRFHHRQPIIPCSNSAGAPVARQRASSASGRDSRRGRAEGQQASSDAAGPRPKFYELLKHTASAVTRIEALGSAIALVNSGIDPAAAGCARAWSGRCGDGGALTAFVKEHLHSIAPSGGARSAVDQGREDAGKKQPLPEDGFVSGLMMRGRFLHAPCRESKENVSLRLQASKVPGRN